MIEREKFITRQMVRDNPDKIYLYGDNLQRKGFGGQAREMRGEPNTVGIVTKAKPTNDLYSYLTDKQLDYNKSVINRDFAEIQIKVDLLKTGLEVEDITIVVPEDGIGTGRARLAERAPLTFAYLQKKLEELS